MDKVIDVRFERMEKALANLVDSIAKYTPSAHSSTELNAASADLAQGLEDLQTHQRNHARIQELRGISANLDSQIKDTLVQLAQARKELTSTSTTVFPEKGTFPINYTELLNYGRHIAKTTVPPSGVANALSNSAPPTQPESAVESAAPTPGGTPNGVASAPNGALDQLSGQQTTNSTALPDHIQDSLNPLAGAIFVPWPSEAHIRNGALAQLDFLSSRGVDPEGYDPDEEEAQKKRKEEEERAREEQERLEREEKERRIREQMELARAEREKAREKEAAERQARGDTGNAEGQSSGAAPGAGASAGGQKQAQFQFLQDDDDESD
ncbi:Mediator of RNA polymerase II transcription subunit 4 [Apiospora arundinis]